MLRGGDDQPKDLLAKEVAKDYMEKWKGKPWESAKHSCDISKLPKTTDNLIFNICGRDTEKKRCVCNIAKAHSCHVGCRTTKFVCPAGCKQKKCFQGDPKNGGKELSKGGHNGVCYKYCSQAGWGARYCGVGGPYQTGLYLDCTGCEPRDVKTLSDKEKKDYWTKCMTDCFPTPTCAEMCGEGTPDCYAKCVEGYSHVVEPYWELFKGSLEAVPLLAESEAVVKDEAAKEEPPPPAKVAPAKSVEDQQSEDEFDGEMEDDEFDEEDEGEWEDPWADDNEWDEEDYGDDEEYFLIKGARKVPSGDLHSKHNSTGHHHVRKHHVKGKRKRRRSPEMVKALKQARALGLRD